MRTGESDLPKIVAYTVVEAKKSFNLLSASYKPRKFGNVIWNTQEP